MYSDWRIPTIIEINMLHNKKWLVEGYCTTKTLGAALWSSTNHPGFCSNWVSVIPKGFTKRMIKILRGGYGYYPTIAQAKKSIVDTTHPLFKLNYVILVRDNKEHNKLEFTKISKETMTYDDALEYAKGTYEVNKSIRYRRKY